VLRKDLGYFVPEPQIINAKGFGVPQNRERIYIVGFHSSTNVMVFNYPKPLDKKVTFADIKEKKVPATKRKKFSFRPPNYRFYTNNSYKRNCKS
jgi:DNA (cytosine-5)-methyltransferase 1